MNAFYQFLLLSMVAMLVSAGCAGRGSKDSSNKSAFKPLSEAEAKVYITPTIYYVPQFDLTQQSCDQISQKKIKNRNGDVLFSVCAEIYNSCLLQGTCEIRNEKERAIINVADVVNSEYRFKKVDDKICRYGFGGGREICLDPFHSVAADLSIYKFGQVIYIPDVVGLVLPDGSKHDGYFIIRDSGGAIKGYGRFDFFTGFLSNNKSKNPFAQIGFSGKETHVLYYVITGEETARILKKRSFPNLNVSN